MEGGGGGGGGSRLLLPIFFNACLNALNITRLSLTGKRLQDSATPQPSSNSTPALALGKVVRLLVTCDQVGGDAPMRNALAVFRKTPKMHW